MARGTEGTEGTWENSGTSEIAGSVSASPVSGGGSGESAGETGRKKSVLLSAMR